MAEANGSGTKVTIWIIFICLAVFLLTRSSKKAEPISRIDEAPIQTFGGNDCTIDCSGHEAGYRWAEEKGIQDDDDCEEAGEHSNSPSFAEGCESYVNGDSLADDNDDQNSGSDDNN
jgi:hypothetical protein